MPLDTDVLIRQRAYEIWEKEDRPHGRDKQHWEAAMRAITGAGEAARTVKRVRRTAGAEPAEGKRAKATS